MFHRQVLPSPRGQLTHATVETLALVRPASTSAAASTSEAESMVAFRADRLCAVMPTMPVRVCVCVCVCVCVSCCVCVCVCVCVMLGGRVRNALGAAGMHTCDMPTLS